MVHLAGAAGWLAGSELDGMGEDEHLGEEVEEDEVEEFQYNSGAEI